MRVRKTFRDRFAIGVEHDADMKAHGNVVDREYEITVAIDSLTSRD